MCRGQSVSLAGCLCVSMSVYLADCFYVVACMYVQVGRQVCRHFMYACICMVVLNTLVLM